MLLARAPVTARPVPSEARTAMVRSAGGPARRAVLVWLGALVLAVVTACGSSGSSTGSASGSAAGASGSGGSSAVVITIKDFQFTTPASVAPGAKITVKNEDSTAHTV